MNDQNFDIINKIIRFAYIHTRFYFQHFVSSLFPLPNWSVHKTKLCKQSFGLGDVSPASRWYTILPSFLNSFTLQRCILQTLMDLQEIFSGKMSSDVWDPDMGGNIKSNFALHILISIFLSWRNPTLPPQRWAVFY